MKINSDIKLKREDLKRDFCPSEIYLATHPQRYYMVIQNSTDQFNLLNLENGRTLFQQDMVYERMNEILNSHTSCYEFIENCEMLLNGNIKQRIY